MDIAEWLRGLGLEQYEPAFRENQISPDLLPSLTAEDLKDLSIVLVGHRRRLLEAIADLRSEQATTTVTADARPAAQSEAERRQLSVMFCDLVGSTALSARLDPEDLRNLLGSYHRFCAEVIERTGGFVAKYMGDGVLAYFGYPAAHEDDAERAVRAGLELLNKVGEVEAPERLQVRIGIATGVAVVGDLIGQGAAQEHAVVGETPNLAARLQALADPGTLVIDATTRRLTGRLFEYADLGAVELKGLAAPAVAARVLRESGTESRFEALRAPSTPCIGRGEELALLERRWERVKVGEGSVVLLSGEPGIGKSRLAQALLERIGAELYTRLRYFCSPHHQDSALYPHIVQLARAAGFARDDTDEVKLGKLDAVLAQSDASDDAIALLAELLSIETDQRAKIRQMTPQARREKTLAALLAQLVGLANRRPVLVIYEDVHWIDPSSRELLDRTIERLERLPMLLLVTFRSEFKPPWAGRPNVASVALNRLDRKDTATMIAGIAGDGLPTEITQQIAERTDGVPLFIEECTKAVIEFGPQASEGLSRIPHPDLAVPAALHGSLMARLDRLGPAAREAAQKGAAIGRQFSHELISAVAGMPHSQLEDALARLVGAELIYRRGTPPDAEYSFKHALVQDAAYGTLLRSRRQQIHARIAAVLEADFVDTIAPEPELLARHLTEAGLLEKAVQWWLRAGERATERSANLEAIAHLKRGIDILGRLPESRERDEEELLLQAALIGPSMAIAAGPGAPARRAVELGKRIGVNSPAQFHAILARGWLANVLTITGELRSALPFAAETLSIAELFGDPLLRSRAHDLIGEVHQHLGDVGEARRHFEEALTLYDPERDRAKAARFAYDSYTACHAFLGLILWDQGFPDEALRHAEEAIIGGRAAAHPFSEVLATSFRAMLHQLRGEGTLCLDWANAALALATEQGLRLFVGIANTLVGWALVTTAAAEEEGLARLRAGIDTLRALSARAFRSLLFSLLPDACLALSRIEEGLSAVREGLAEVEEIAAGCYEPALHQLHGQLILTSKEPDETCAEASFRKAIVISRGQGTKSFELRAASSLARLLARQGKCEEAHALLAPIYGWFAEGFGTKDLIEAKALLDELEAALGRSPATATPISART